MLRTLMLALIGASLAAAMTGCETNAATGRSQFAALSRDEEIKLGSEAKPGLTTEFGGEVKNPDLQAYLTDMGKRLATHTETDNPSLPWEFTMLDSDVINAFALPGGKVFVSRGLIQHMTNEAQLAAVVGHEIGHVTARHTSERMGDSLLIGTGAAIAGAVVGAVSRNDAVKIGAPVAFAVGSQVILLKYSRSQELEADKLGVRYMVKENYNPIGCKEVMEILDKASGSRDALFGDMLATHPDPKARIKQAEGLLAGDYAFTQSNPQYVTNENEFKAKVLSKLPAPKQTKTTDASPANADRRVFALTSASWCSACAARGD